MTDADIFKLAGEAGFQEMMHMKSGQVFLQPVSAYNCAVELTQFARLVRNLILTEAATACELLACSYDNEHNRSLGTAEDMASIAEDCAEEIRSMRADYP